ncbi:MAG TPA: group III truncated hemoglobin [Prolixibacteraceae bacterium]|nr:group III truncated hemoglobin [Prolixibacteraceae bacterium]
MLQDIATLKDIHNLVDAFYDKVRKDQTIGFFFNERLEGKWEAHHKKLYRFWHTVLLRRPDYFGNPVPVHFNMQLKREHFDHWLQVWCATVDELYAGTIAERAKFRGKTMANAFYKKIRKADEREV